MGYSRAYYSHLSAAACCRIRAAVAEAELAELDPRARHREMERQAARYGVGRHVISRICRDHRLPWFDPSLEAMGW